MHINPARPGRRGSFSVTRWPWRRWRHGATPPVDLAARRITRPRGP